MRESTSKSALVYEINNKIEEALLLLTSRGRATADTARTNPVDHRSGCVTREDRRARPTRSTLSAIEEEETRVLEPPEVI